MTRTVLVAALALSGFTAVVAQQSTPRFEVASVKAQPTREFIDATGLTGSFYLTLRAQFPDGESRAGADNDPDLPAVSTALEEQLGLKLESRRDLVEVLVIDSVQQPTEN